MSMFISAIAQATTFSHCAWGFILCSWHLKTLNNIIFELVICKWSFMGQRSMCPGPGASVPSGSFLLPPPLGPWLPALPGSKQLETPSDSVGAQVLVQEWGGTGGGTYEGLHLIHEYPCAQRNMALIGKQNIPGQVKKDHEREKIFILLFERGPCPTFLRCTGPCKLCSPAFLRKDIWAGTERGKMWVSAHQAGSFHCRGPQAGTSLTGWKNSGKVGVTGVSPARGRVEGDEWRCSQGPRMRDFPGHDKEADFQSRWKLGEHFRQENRKVWFVFF